MAHGSEAARDLRYGRRAGGWLPPGWTPGSSVKFLRDLRERMGGELLTEEALEFRDQRRRLEREHPDLVPGLGTPWEGQARMAEARRTAGLPLDAIDLEALRRHPEPPPFVPGPPTDLERAPRPPAAPVQGVASPSDPRQEANMTTTGPPADLKGAGPEAQRAALLEHLGAGAQLTTKAAQQAIGVSETRAGDLLKALADEGLAHREKVGRGYVYVAAGQEVAKPPPSALAQAVAAVTAPPAPTAAASAEEAAANLKARMDAAATPAPPAPPAGEEELEGDQLDADDLEALHDEALEAARELEEALDDDLSPAELAARESDPEVVAARAAAELARRRAEEAEAAELTRPAPGNVVPGAAPGPQERPPAGVQDLEPPAGAGGVACTSCGARTDLGQPHGAGCAAALTSPAAPPLPPAPPGPDLDAIARAEAAEAARAEWELDQCPHVLTGGALCALRKGHDAAGVPHEPMPTADALAAAKAQEERAQSKAERMAAVIREQAAQALELLKWRREVHTTQLDATRAEAEVAILAGHWSGLTYEQLAESSGYSRAHVGALLKEAKAELDAADPATLQVLRDLEPWAKAALRLLRAQ